MRQPLIVTLIVVPLLAIVGTAWIASGGLPRMHPTNRWIWLVGGYVPSVLIPFAAAFVYRNSRRLAAG